MLEDYRLSDHFRLSEFVNSRTADSMNIQNIPSSAIVENLKHLCNDSLEVIRKKFGPVKINSGYRSPKLNSAVKGSKTSQHTIGTAADFVLYDKNITLEQLFDWCKRNVNYDQLILEPSWIHISYNRINRKEAFKKA